MLDAHEKRHFENLECYKHSQKLLDAAYRLANDLPDYEKFIMATQLRRAALSTLLNIAEGYGRYHYLEKLRFFYFARGSLCETLSIFISANQLGYIGKEQIEWVREIEMNAEKSLNGYIRFIRKQKQGKDEFGKTYIAENDLGTNDLG